jgi:hypothetical protein
VGKHWIGTGRHVYNIENNCLRWGLNCDQLPYKSISNFGHLMACITNLMEYCFSIRGIEFGLLNMHLIHNGSTAVFFPFFSILSFQSCGLPSVASIPRRILCQLVTLILKGYPDCQNFVKSCSKTENHLSNGEVLSKNFEIWRIFSKAKGILQQRYSLIVACVWNFAQRKKIDLQMEDDWLLSICQP